MCSVNKKKINSLDKFDTYLVKLYKTPINPIVYNVLLLSSWYILKILTPYMGILDFDWLITGVFFVYFHI